MIPINELDKHMRIELLDPRWKDLKDRELAKKRESNLTLDRGREVALQLKKLADVRKDIFGGDALEAKKKMEAEIKKGAMKEALAWDGHVATMDYALEKTYVHAQSSEVQQQYAEEKAAIEAQQIGPGLAVSREMFAVAQTHQIGTGTSQRTQSSYSGDAVTYGFAEADLKRQDPEDGDNARDAKRQRRQ